MIELKKVTKSYVKEGAGVTVLRDATFTINKGDYVAIMGASGSGKTTLMNILGLLDKASSGTYLLDGKDVASLDDNELSHLRNRQIGFVFQQFHLMPRISALRNVLLPLLYTERYPRDAEARAKKALHAVLLDERMNYNPNQLSGGQQQRVAIARALIMEPALILADEPTGNLDSTSSEEIMGIFAALHKQKKTIVVITHDKDIAQFADRVLILKDGTICADTAGAKSRVVDATIYQDVKQKQNIK